MKKPLRFRATAIVGVAIASLLGSCAYDPYYGAGGYGGSSGSVNYGTGYGYGYGSSSFSTSIFVSTGNPRWGYDPYCRSYYDYTRRCYYDPYLYGYYPVGYRPPIVVGVPHPYGWNSSRSYCPPPSRVTNVTLVNYQNRENAYRSTNHSWARSVRTDSRQVITVRPQGRGPETTRPSFGRGDSPSERPSSIWGSGRQETPQPFGGFNRGSSSQRDPYLPQTREPSRETRPSPSFGRGSSSSTPSRYNTPIAVPPEVPTRDTGRERPTFDRSPQRSAPEPRSAPVERRSSEPRSAPPGFDSRSSGESRGSMRQGPPADGNPGPSRNERRLR